MKRSKRIYTVDAVARSLAILDAIGSEDLEMGVLEISQKVGIHVSTVYRLLNTMMTHGYVDQNRETKKYLLGIKFFELGMARLRSLDLRKMAVSYLRDLHETLKETVLLGMLRHNEVLVIETFSQERGIVFQSRLGVGEPLHCTGIGKALLAGLRPELQQEVLSSLTMQGFTPNTITKKSELVKELKRIQNHGFAIDDEEILPGVKCVAASILGSDGYAVGAFSVVGPSTRIELRQPEIAERVLEARRLISRQLGYVGFPQPSGPKRTRKSPPKARATSK